MSIEQFPVQTEGKKKGGKKKIVYFHFTPHWVCIKKEASVQNLQGHSSPPFTLVACRRRYRAASRGYGGAAAAALVGGGTTLRSIVLDGLLKGSFLSHCCCFKKKSFRSMGEPTAATPPPPPRLPCRHCRRRRDKKAQFYYVGVSIIKWLSPTLKKSCRIMLLYTSCSFTVEWPRANASAASTPLPPLSPSP